MLRVMALKDDPGKGHLRVWIVAFRLVLIGGKPGMDKINVFQRCVKMNMLTHGIRVSRLGHESVASSQGM